MTNNRKVLTNFGHFKLQNSGNWDTVDLSKLTGKNGFTITGLKGTSFASSFSSAGDFNADGIDDIIIGAPDGGKFGVAYSGLSYVIFGKQGIDKFDLTKIDGTNGFILYGINPNDHSGSAVSRAGDINGDGIDDILIGAPNVRNGEGEMYVVFGKKSTNFNNLDLSQLDGKNGFIIRGNGAPQYEVSQNLGSSLAKAGDINGDGIDDILIGAPNGHEPDCSYCDFGGAYVIFGKKDGFSSVLNITNIQNEHQVGFYLLSANNKQTFNTHLGSGFSPVQGDINGDGIDDILIGAGSSSWRGSDGKVIVYYGEKNFSKHFINNGSLPVFYNSFYTSDGSGDIGSAITIIKNFFGHGENSLAMGAPSLTQTCGPTSFGQGAVYLLYANTINENYNSTSSYPLSSITSKDGLEITVNTGSCNGLGTAISTGDINGDGLGDIIMGAPQYVGNYAFAIGLNKTTGNAEWYNFANGGSGVGNIIATSDINGDGKDDILLSSGETLYIVFGHEYSPSNDYTIL